MMLARSTMIALLLAWAGCLAGCAQSQTTTGTVLPDLVKDTGKLLTKDEQKRAISDITQVKDTEIGAAEKQIQKSH